MKNRMIAAMLAAAMAFSLTACGDSEESTTGTEIETTTNESGVSRTANPEVASMEMEIDASELVELCDYTGIAVTLTGTYEMTDEQVDDMVLSELRDYYGLGYVEVTDRDTIEDGDVVNVDYTGYLDGEAFDGGSATDQMVEISDDSGYIDGFVDGLVGATVGDTISYEVTFPDEYSSNEDLAGQTTTFEFTIYGIYQAATMDEIADVVTDEEIDEIFGDYGISTLQDYIDYESQYIVSYLASLKEEAIKEQVEEYLLENCTVEVPEDYLSARVTEYVIMFEESYLDDDEDLETYLSDNYSMTVDEAYETWTSGLKEQIEYELIYTKIATEEGIELDEDDYADYISNIISYYGYEDEADLYDYYGAGSEANGEKYMRMLYYMNLGAEYVCDNADVTIDVSDDEDTETTEE